MKNVFIYSNNDANSLKAKNELKALLEKENITVKDDFSSDIELVIAIGGDGTFLRAIKASDYSDVLILGINTGHLGFFADYSPNQLDEVVKVCTSDNYLIQLYKTIKTEVETKDSKIILDPAINDIYVKHGLSSIIHLDLSIGDSFIESMAGDGLLISSSAGSTAYNYSLGSSIVDPRLDLLQIKPVAPSNNAVYRSITSSLLVPGNENIVIEPKDVNDTVIVVDGNENKIEDVKKIIITLQDRVIKIIRKPDYKFWNKVRTKFI